MLRHLAGTAPWIGDYLLGRLQKQSMPEGKTVHVMFTISDHWEPSVGSASPSEAAARARDWERLYPRITAGHEDADGRKPQHTYFYPWDEYRRSEIEMLAELSNRHLGEVELHLHHREDTGASLARKLEDAVGLFRQSGCFGSHADGEPAFGFVHGDWGLDNSRHAEGSFCGVNDELIRLKQAGCYADFTFPAVGFAAQPRWVNRILRVTDDPERPKSYDRGREVSVADPLSSPAGDLVIFQGPIGIYRDGHGRIHLNEGHLTGGNPGTPERIDGWVRAGVGVRGRPEWVFIKLHTHGCSDPIRMRFLGGALDEMWTDLERRYNDGERYRLHYVTAREAYNIMRAAEHGLSGDPGQYRDYEISRPPCRAPATRELLTFA